MICICRRSGRISRNGRPVISCPSNLTLPVGRLDQPQHAAAGRGLAAAALPDQAEHFALVHRERHAVDGAHVADGAREQPLLDREMFLQIPDFEDRRRCLAVI